MDAWIDLARGPLFRISLAVCVLGLGYRLGDRGRPRSSVPGGAPATAAFRSATIAARHARLAAPACGCCARARSTASRRSLFHVGDPARAAVPRRARGLCSPERLPAGWPVLPAGVADVLTGRRIVALAALLVGRLGSAASRAPVAAPRTCSILVRAASRLAASACFVAAHPAWSPFGARSMLLAPHPARQPGPDPHADDQDRALRRSIPLTQLRRSSSAGTSRPRPAATWRWPWRRRTNRYEQRWRSSPT